MSDSPAPNIGLDLQRIHRVITRGLNVLRQNAPALAAGGFAIESDREGFWKYCRALEGTTHGHHQTEDRLFFPFLEPRLPDADFRRLRAEHEVLVGLLAGIAAAREAASPTALEHALARFDGVWHLHIAKEEAWFSPEIMAQVMTVPEHIQMARDAATHSAAHAQPAALCVPFLLYNAEGDDRAHFLGAMPSEITQKLVPVTWKEDWAPMSPYLLP